MAKKADTKSKILLAARELFVKKGFHGTSISKIAKAAGINNQSLIYHHFASKEDLWKQVKSDIVAKYSQDNPAAWFKAGMDLRTVLNKIVMQRFAIYEENPDVIRMMAWQKLENDSDKLSGGSSLAPDAWKGILSQLQEDGALRADMDLDMAILYIVSVIAGALSEDQRHFLNSAQKKKEYLDFIVDSLVRALKK